MIFLSTNETDMLRELTGRSGRLLGEVNYD
jgi:hypothetical protein